jgi:SAC3 domain-containing protein 1
MSSSGTQHKIFFLVHRILFHQVKPFNCRYDFIFDRCRAVRQEIVIQNFSCAKTLKLLEPIVMFLSLSMYRLNGSPMMVFDPKICLQHLQECLLKCLTCYDEMDRLGLKDYSQDNRVVIEGLYLMLNMDDTVALQRAIRLDPPIKKSFIISKSIHIALNFHLKSFYKVLKGIQELPHLLSAVASLQIARLRKEILHVFSIAYNSSALSVPFDFLQRLLIYDELEPLIRDLRGLGIYDDNDQNPTTLVFRRTKFDSSKAVVSQVKINKAVSEKNG